MPSLEARPCIRGYIDRFKAPGALIMLAAIAFIIYSNVLNGPFLYDDTVYVRDNPLIRSLADLPKLTGTRQITFITFALNYAIGGSDTFVYHITNVAIHALNAFMVFIFLSLTFKTPLMRRGAPITGAGIAFATALLFLTHPLQTQAVAYITQRLASLATLFYLLSIVLYAKSRLLRDEGRRTHIEVYLLSVAVAAAAQKTKEITFTLPFLIALYEFTFFDLRDGLKKRLLYLLPLFATLAIIPITLFSNAGQGDPTVSNIARKIMGMQVAEMSDLSNYAYLMTELRVVVMYLRLIVLPVNQAAVYDAPVYTTFSDPNVYLSFVFLAAIFAGAVYLYIRSIKRSEPYGLLISFGVFWFFVAVSVESSVIPIKDVAFEHRVYLPGIGLITAASAFIFFVFEAALKDRAVWVWAIILMATGANGVSTYKRNVVWTDGLVFWQDVVNKSPGRAGGHNNLGIEYADRGKTDLAAKEFEETLRLAPYFEDAFYNLGVIYGRKGRDADAMEMYRQAIRLKPDKAADAHLNLGILYKKAGKKREASVEFGAALQLDPGMNAAREELDSLNR